MTDSNEISKANAMRIFHYMESNTPPKSELDTLAWMSKALKHFELLFEEVYQKGFVDGVSQQVEGLDKV